MNPVLDSEFDGLIQHSSDDKSTDEARALLCEISAVQWEERNGVN